MDHQPSPNLVALGTGPFYRAQIGRGDFGNFPGLHGVGAAVHVFGGYPGSHIGPALIFGYGVGCDFSNAPPNAASPEFEPTADMEIGLGC
ncbi:hypothetical protein [Arthrobacter sp. P2b]|uniref:hypothetical protein n=1 Tax=Arthrobacter sp. P2b TaxID=1938741 RepID=UPI0009A5954C|nr:hypothetical protein [Arthrobacter sp. P2b]